MVFCTCITPDLVDRESAEEHTKDHYIEKGYRICKPKKRFRQIMRSLLQVHNESVNVWTHFIGAVVFLTLIVWTLLYRVHPSVSLNTKQMEFINTWLGPIQSNFTNSSNSTDVSWKSYMTSLAETSQELSQEHWHQFTNSMSEKVKNLMVQAQHFPEFITQESEFIIDSFLKRLNMMKTIIMPPKWPIFIFLFVAFSCLASSTAFHLFNVHSRKWFLVLLRMDYAGITLLIAGSFVPMVYYGFYCHKYLMLIYLLMPSLFSSVILYYIFHKNFHKFFLPEYTFYRLSAFLGFGLSGGLPVIHMLFVNSDSFNRVHVAKWMVLMGLCYVVGGVLYGLRFPEKWFPRVFDVWGASHQLFHLFVLAGALSHYFGIMTAYNSRMQYGCPAT
eukprot:GHVL01018539.1.p1 GENE.GHVL01018539.1~~GHVL01018539.1.p1  ORF type:complete len:387 (-),score=16.91 GHVL01018539.1:15-1175(-)